MFLSRGLAVLKIAVMITSETKRFVVDLLKDMVHIDELEH